MTDDADLRASFQTRWAELGIAKTAPLSAFDVTVRPDSHEQPATPVTSPAWTQPRAEELPRISVSFSDATTPQSTQGLEATDLEVHGVLGEGGMGRVHAARQRSLGREVAVKTVKAESAAASAVHAILREAVITGALEHPGIVPVHALGMDGHGRPVLVMKRIEGVEWRSLIHDPDHPGWAARAGDRLEVHLEILKQVCQAVHFAHSRAVLHRDIKPENVMLGDFGEVYLVDWGIAIRDVDQSKDRGFGLAGSPAYMAPEMVAGERPTIHTDVYLLGATLHEVLTGEYLHQGDSLEDVLLHAYRSDPTRYDDEVPDELADLCRRSTSRDPRQRPASALVFREELDGFLKRRSVIALEQRAGERLQELQSMLETSGSDTAPADLRLAYQRATEARFGFTQALEVWPQSQVAARGVDACVEAQIDLELRQQHVETAKAMLQELDAPSTALQQRVANAERQLARRLAVDARLQALAREHDPSVGTAERTRGLAALTGAAVAVAIFALAQPGLSKLRAETLVAFALFVNLVTVAVTLILRRTLMKNAFNRKLVGAMFLAGGSLLLSRVLGLLYGLPISRIFVQDLLVLTVACAGVSFMLLPWLAPMCVVLLAAMVVCMVLPHYSMHAFSVVAMLTPLAAAFALWMRARSETADRPPESGIAE
ncbi:MAG: protein kinase [Polyangiaceae bacterium]